MMAINLQSNSQDHNSDIPYKTLYNSSKVVKSSFKSD